MVKDILDAAARVLARDGAAQFTTARVAETAGVSVGSLYQYFPNKEALLFRLQRDEWDETLDHLEGILADQGVPPKTRLHRAVAHFFRTEADEAGLRHALDDAGALFREAPEARIHEERTHARLRVLFEAFLPAEPAVDRSFAAEFVMTVVGALAEKVTARRRDPDELDAWTEATVDLVLAYLEGGTRMRHP
jgi:AcrR family transcriptional regulator